MLTPGRLLNCLVLAASVLTGAGCGDSGSPPRAEADLAPAGSASGAAREYRMVYAELPASLKDRLREERSAHSLSGELRVGLEGVEALVQRLVEASRLGESDFGVEYNEGLNTVLPHLTEMRTLTWLLRCDAFHLHAKGEREAAAERVAALLRLAGHLGEDDTALLSWMVAVAAAITAANTAAELAGGGLGPRSREVMRRELDSIDRRDVYGGSRVLWNYGHLVAWSIRNAMVPVEEFGVDFSSKGEQERERLALRMEEITRELSSAWRGSGADVRIAQILLRVDAEVPELVRLVPDATRMRMARSELLDALDDALAALR